MRPWALTCRCRHMGRTEDTAKKPVATWVLLHRRGSLCNDPRNKTRKKRNGNITKKTSQHRGSADLFDAWRPRAVCITNVPMSLAVPARLFEGAINKKGKKIDWNRLRRRNHLSMFWKEMFSVQIVQQTQTPVLIAHRRLFSFFSAPMHSPVWQTVSLLCRGRMSWLYFTQETIILKDVFWTFVRNTYAVLFVLARSKFFLQAGGRWWALELKQTKATSLWLINHTCVDQRSSKRLICFKLHLSVQG